MRPIHLPTFALCLASALPALAATEDEGGPGAQHQHGDDGLVPVDQRTDQHERRLAIVAARRPRDWLTDLLAAADA